MIDKAALDEIVDIVAKPWAESAYYDNAEKMMHLFWGENALFRKLFSQLDLASVIELACGHGRHSEVVQPMAGQLTLMDVHEGNLGVCRKRLADARNVTFQKTQGHSFQPVAPGSQTAIFCYDAMVHFAPELVEAYLEDAMRVLTPGGMALLHHSNYDAPTDRHYGQNPHARNHMTRDMFDGFAKTAGLDIVEAHQIAWGGETDLDGLTLLRKSA